MLSGKDKGRTGTVIRVLSRDDKVVVEGLNMVKRHTKKKREGTESGIVSKPSAVYVAKVQLICPKCGKQTRVKIERKNGKKERICSKCKSSVDSKKGSKSKSNEK